ncbi:MAG: hypothetical protein M1819_007362 [Sarea resinae]|nr:MAG: hypothetical protein M1819_007362 [Sarea resinae]
MASALLDPPAWLQPSQALRLSQQAPLLLQKHSTGQSLHLPLFPATEKPETWIILENLMLSCLRTGDDESARLCLERLSDRFGVDNERVMGLRGMYQEAVAEDENALRHILEEYDAVLSQDPTNMPIAKRRIALLRSMSQPVEAITALTKLLDTSPTDVEAWSELSDLYYSQGQYPRAIFCLEEILLVVPNAWNIHARLGELAYTLAIAPETSSDSNQGRALVESLRRFCRSIELCDDYLRGHYGLKLTSSRLLPLLSQGSKSSSALAELAPPSLETVQKLNERATSKLVEIVRRSSAGEDGWDGYDQAEIIAAKELLDRDAQPKER